MKFFEALKQESEEKIVEKVGWFMVLIAISMEIVFEINEPDTTLQLIIITAGVSFLFLTGFFMYLNPKYFSQDKRRNEKCQDKKDQRIKREMEKEEGEKEEEQEEKRTEIME